MRFATTRRFWNGPESLELTGIDSAGRVCWSELEFRYGRLHRASTWVSTGPGPYRAAMILWEKLVVAVTDRSVVRLFKGSEGLRPQLSTEIGPINAVACFAQRSANRLLVVTSDARIAQLPL